MHLAALICEMLFLEKYIKSFFKSYQFDERHVVGSAVEKSPSPIKLNLDRLFKFWFVSGALVHCQTEKWP